MAITIQRTAAASSAGSVASQTLAVQIDSGTSVGLLVCAWVAANATSETVTYNGGAMTYINGMSGGASLQAVRWYYLANPTTGTNNIVVTPSISAGTRIQAWVLEGVHQSTAPTFSAGSNGVTIDFTQSTTVGAAVFIGVSRGGTVTWTIGGGATETSQASYYSAVGTGNIDTAAVGYLIADATSEAPTYTLSGGDSSSNVYGSVQWLEAAGASTFFRPYFITG